MAKTPNSFDRQVGVRLRARRMMLGITQQTLATHLEVTFQQVQKYEKGVNRIGAGRLQQIARFLDVSPSYFLEGAGGSSPSSGLQEPDQQAYVVDFLATADGLALTRAFARIRNPALRRKLIDLVTAIAQDDADRGESAEEF